MAAYSVVRDRTLTKFKLIQAFIVVLVTCKYEEDSSKIKSLEWSQHFSHYKSMGIFPGIQGELTPHLEVWSCRISNPFKILWLSSLPARMSKIQSKNEGDKSNQ